MTPPLDPPRRLLLGPGPSDVAPRVLEALARPTIGHLDPEYLRIMDAIGRMLRRTPERQLAHLRANLELTREEVKELEEQIAALD